MATSAPDHLIRQDLVATRPNGRADRRGAPTGHSSSPVSLSPSPPYVRVFRFVAQSLPRNRASRGHEPGQRHPDGATQDTQSQQQDERFCIVLWVVGASLAFLLVLLAWLVIVTSVVHESWTTPPPFFVPPQSSEYTAVPPTNANPWPSVPSTCIVPVTLSTPPPRLNVGAPYSFGPTNESSRPVFCLFNNTRVYAWHNITNSPWNYVFAILPFELCPYVVYWSVGIEDGNVTSRLPSFDGQYGLHRLRAIADSLNFKTIKILLALGGYPEDAPHFWRLVWDKEIMNRLLSNVVDSLYTFGLSGVTVHWVAARAGCQGPDDVAVLKTLLRSFRTWFNSKMMFDVLVTVILELNRASQMVVQEAADVVDHFFLATQNADRNAPSTDLQDTCKFRTKNMHDAYRMFPGSSCFLHGANQVTMDNFPDRMFMIDDASEVQKRLDFAEINVTLLVSAPGDSSQACVLLHDLDADNYVDQCGGRFTRYALMRNYYYGAINRTLSGNGDVTNTLARC
ncbi:hypothetical protein MTO96_035192 [Rhipicephalus appendiculatus]